MIDIYSKYSHMFCIGNAGWKNKVSGIASNQAVTRAMSDSLVCEYTSKDSMENIMRIFIWVSEMRKVPCFGLWFYNFKFAELTQKSSKELFLLFYNSIIMV